MDLSVSNTQLIIKTIILCHEVLADIGPKLVIHTVDLVMLSWPVSSLKYCVMSLIESHSTEGGHLTHHVCASWVKSNPTRSHCPTFSQCAWNGSQLPCQVFRHVL